MKSSVWTAFITAAGLLSVAPAWSLGAVEPAPLGAAEEAIVERDSASLAGFYLAGRSANIAKDVNAAAGFFTRALESDPNNATLLNQAVLYNVASGNVRKAREFSEPLLAIEPNQRLPHLTLAVTAFHTGDIETGLSHIRTLKSIDGPFQQLVGSLVEAWAVAETRPAAAIRLLDDVRGQDWLLNFTRQHAGFIAESAGLLDIAEDRLRLAYEADQTDIRLVEAFIRTFLRQGERARAEELKRRFVQRLGGNDAAERQLEAVLASDPVAPFIGSPREGMAEALFSVGRGIGGSEYVTAAALLQLALHLNPGSDYAAMALGTTFEGMRQHEAAIEVYSQVEDNSPVHREAQMQAALNLNVLERRQEAVGLLADLVADDPDDIPVAIALGNVHRALEDFASAGDVYHAAIETFDGPLPDAYWTLHYFRGIAHERTKQWEKAEADFRRALEMSPDHPLVLNYLGYSLIDRNEKLAEAIDMVRKAVEQRPQDGYIVDSLGWAYYRLGEYDKAVTQLERAVALRPADPTINDHLGDAYWKVGRKLEATFQWKHARDMDPDDTLKARVLRKLDVGLDRVLEEEKAAAETASAAEPATAQ
ncbi:MAG: tetratricopeptide repeat protein [Pseudomonadota bacterium]